MSVPGFQHMTWDDRIRDSDINTLLRILVFSGQAHSVQRCYSVAVEMRSVLLLPEAEAVTSPLRIVSRSFTFSGTKVRLVQYSEVQEASRNIIVGQHPLHPDALPRMRGRCGSEPGSRRQSDHRRDVPWGKRLNGCLNNGTRSFAYRRSKKQAAVPVNLITFDVRGSGCLTGSVHFAANGPQRSARTSSVSTREYLQRHHPSSFCCLNDRAATHNARNMPWSYSTTRVSARPAMPQLVYDRRPYLSVTESLGRGREASGSPVGPDWLMSAHRNASSRLTDH